MSNAAFKANFSKLIQKSNADVDELVRQVAQKLGASIDKISPVDEGRFRGNTNPSVVEMDLRTDYPPDPEGTAAIERLETVLNGWKRGQTIYIVNSLPYARRLEYGWSQQAPSGVFRHAVQKYSEFLETTVKDAS